EPATQEPATGINRSVYSINCTHCKIEIAFAATAHSAIGFQSQRWNSQCDQHAPHFVQGFQTDVAAWYLNPDSVSRMPRRNTGRESLTLTRKCATSWKLTGTHPDFMTQ
ncbi:MAG: hypothetical protein KJS91_07130, partial [Planctomycetes bacterium]|nr:hypothetical protein [Planctomycetota bacterium]